MYRSRIEQTNTKSEAAERLQQALLNYHDLQQALKDSPLHTKRLQLSDWQSKRLRQTHADLHQQEKYQTGLEFLLSDLYAAQDFSARDNDLERIFPKMVKLLPNKVLDTVAQLVELNLLTQELDHKVTEALFTTLGFEDLNTESYCEAYRHCNNLPERINQIQHVSDAGNLLDRYARSSVLRFSLSMMETPAEMAGLSALHSFLSRGFDAFYQMQSVDSLMQILAQRETEILKRIFACDPDPFAPCKAIIVPEFSPGTPAHA